MKIKRKQAIAIVTILVLVLPLVSLAASKSTVPTHRRSDSGIIRHPTFGPVGLTCLKTIPLMTLLTVFAVLAGLQNASLSGAEAWFLVALGESIAILVVWMLSITGSNYGIVLIDEGVIVVSRNLLLGPGNHRLTLWSQLREPSVTGGLTSEVSFETQSLPIFLSKNQARAVLSDPRCPLIDQSSKEVLKLVRPR
jgi:hypothetical protein